MPRFSERIANISAMVDTKKDREEKRKEKKKMFNYFFTVGALW